MRARTFIAFLAGFLPFQEAADAAILKGTYSMRAVGSHGSMGRGKDRERVPFCGSSADKFISANRDNLTVKYSGSSVMVGGEEWDLDGDDGNSVSAHKPKTAQNVRIEVWFRRSGTGSAAVLSYSETDSSGAKTCATGQQFSGSYSAT